jgi:hypothetical protein
MRLTKIAEDISRIEESLKLNDFNAHKELYEELYNVYESEINDLGNAMLDLWDTSVFYHNLNAPDYDQWPEKEYPENYKKNLVIIKSKLMLLLPTDGNQSSTNGVNVHIHNDNTSSATNIVKMEINISYSDVKKQVEAMEDSIGYDEVQLIKAKIDELEKIIESGARRSEKWNKAKAIGKWIFDKSVDVGIALLPLLLKI